MTVITDKDLKYLGWEPLEDTGDYKWTRLDGKKFRMKFGMVTENAEFKYYTMHVVETFPDFAAKVSSTVFRGNPRNVDDMWNVMQVMN